MHQILEHFAPNRSDGYTEEWQSTRGKKGEGVRQNRAEYCLVADTKYGHRSLNIRRAYSTSAIYILCFAYKNGILGNFR